MICDNVENLRMLTDQLSVLRFNGREYTRGIISFYGVFYKFDLLQNNDIIDKVFFVTS